MKRPLVLATLLALTAISLAPLPAAALVRCRDFAQGRNGPSVGDRLIQL